MATYRSRHWSVELPDGWEAQSDGESDLLYATDGPGTLQLTAVVQDEEVDGEFLSYLVEEHIEAGAEPEEVSCGDFNGLALSYGADDGYWAEWYLGNGRLLLFASYQCELADEGKEEPVVERLLATLRKGSGRN